MSEENFRFCRKCLTRDIIDRDDYFKVIKEMVDNLPPKEKAEAATYESRLLTCTKCDRLFDGMCNACGCYVELRAAKQKSNCPYNKW